MTSTIKWLPCSFTSLLCLSGMVHAQAVTQRSCGIEREFYCTPSFLSIQANALHTTIRYPFDGAEPDMGISVVDNQAADARSMSRIREELEPFDVVKCVTNFIFYENNFLINVCRATLRNTKDLQVNASLRLVEIMPNSDFEYLTNNYFFRKGSLAYVMQYNSDYKGDMQLNKFVCVCPISDNLNLIKANIVTSDEISVNILLLINDFDIDGPLVFSTLLLLIVPSRNQANFILSANDLKVFAITIDFFVNFGDICDEVNLNLDICQQVAIEITDSNVNNKLKALVDTLSSIIGVDLTDNVLTIDSDKENENLEVNEVLAIAPINGFAIKEPTGLFNFSPNMGFSSQGSLGYNVFKNGTYITKLLYTNSRIETPSASFSSLFFLITSNNRNNATYSFDSFHYTRKEVEEKSILLNPKMEEGDKPFRVVDSQKKEGDFSFVLGNYKFFKISDIL